MLDTGADKVKTPKKRGRKPSKSKVRAEENNLGVENSTRVEVNKEVIDFIDDQMKQLKELRDKEIQKPEHYNIEGRREAIEEMLLLFGADAVKAFCKLNAYKYIYRAPHKGSYEDDMAKANVYLGFLENLEKGLPIR